MKKKKKKKHASLQGSVRGYIREISVAMFLQIQTDIHVLVSVSHYSASYTVAYRLNQSVNWFTS